MVLLPESVVFEREEDQAVARADREAAGRYRLSRASRSHRDAAAASGQFRESRSSLAAAVCCRLLAEFACLLNGFAMLFLISITAAILAWLLRHPRFAQTGFPALKIRYADVGTIYQQPALISARYGLSGRPDYLIRVDDGVVPVELKSVRSPRSGRPYEGHLLQLACNSCGKFLTVEGSCPDRR